MDSLKDKVPPEKANVQKKENDIKNVSKGEDSEEGIEERVLEIPQSSKLSSTALKNIETMKREFEKKRKILVQNVSVGTHESNNKLMASIIGSKDFQIVYNSNDKCFRMIFPDAQSASNAISKINDCKSSKLTAQYGHPDSMLFVGNLPLTYDKDQLRELFSPHGKILRCFVVYSFLSGESKGYGFVEYSTREEATATKANMATRLVGSRALRVDFADNGMQTVEDLQSKTIFVDKLPKGMKNESRLVDLISKYGTVNFCQIALLPNGCPRGFAFVDMSSSIEAEAVQLNCNRSKLDGQEIRVSYGMPCRPGACILHPRHNNGTHVTWNNKVVPHKIVGPYCNGAPALPTGVMLNNEPMISFTESAITHIGPHPSYFPFVPFTYAYNTQPMGFLKDTTLINSYHSDSTTSTTSSNGSRDDTSINSDDSSGSDKENHPRKQAKSTAGQKRRLQDEDKEDVMTVYDKPYIGQHDQGIQYQHPLKRIKKC